MKLLSKRMFQYMRCSVHKSHGWLLNAKDTKESFNEPQKAYVSVLFNKEGEGQVANDSRSLYDR